MPRLIGGIGIGMLSMVSSLHISEINPTKVIGRVLDLEEFSIVISIVVAFDHLWHTFPSRRLGLEVAFVQTVLAFALDEVIYFPPFSPWLVMVKGQSREALQGLTQS